MELLHRPPPLAPRKPSHLSSSRRHGSAPPVPLLQHANTLCGCSIPGDVLCKYYGQCQEPWAWTIEKLPIKTQTNSPLFTILPRELRDQVFEYAMIDNKVDSFEALIRRSGKMRLPQGTVMHDMALNLLRTCRAAYLEAWSLPLTLNPLVVYELQHGIKTSRMCPWQLALIQSLDITAQQVDLEGGSLRKFLISGASWRSKERSQGSYIAPQMYHGQNSEPKVFATPIAFSHTIIPFASTEPRHFLSHILGETLLLPNLEVPWSSATRVARARPLLHLTIRLGAKQWWTWTDQPHGPRAPDPNGETIALDPILGNGSPQMIHRPSPGRMKALAERRRLGDHPAIPENCGWAHTIGELTHLKSLVLVLESFEVKRWQLENVVEAAKTWVFPIFETEHELAWDGVLGMSSWSISPGGSRQVLPVGRKWYVDANEFDVRTVKFVRRRVA